MAKSAKQIKRMSADIDRELAHRAPGATGTVQAFKEDLGRLVVDPRGGLIDLSNTIAGIAEQRGHNRHAVKASPISRAQWARAQRNGLESEGLTYYADAVFAPPRRQGGTKTGRRRKSEPRARAPRNAKEPLVMVESESVIAASCAVVGFVATPMLNQRIEARPLGQYLPPSVGAAVLLTVAGMAARKAGYEKTGRAGLALGIGFAAGTIASATLKGGVMAPKS
jgi:hypothetical protein